MITRINTSLASTQIGSKVELQCVSEGDPIPTVTWYSPNGTELITLTGKDSTIFVDIDSEDDFGDYRCTAYNGLGLPVEKIVSVEPIGKYIRDCLILIPLINLHVWLGISHKYCNGALKLAMIYIRDCLTCNPLIHLYAWLWDGHKYCNGTLKLTMIYIRDCLI